MENHHLQWENSNYFYGHLTFFYVKLPGGKHDGSMMFFQWFIPNQTFFAPKLCSFDPTSRQGTAQLKLHQ